MPTLPHLSPTTPKLLLAALSLTSLTCGLAIAAWGQSNNWQLAQLSVYQVFPVFGLLAFSIMWSQYTIEALKNYLKVPGDLRAYFRYTSYLVLGAILIHPGLLIAQRYHDGYGLPPGSYETYVAPMQRWIVILGSLSLLMFLAFEFRRFFRNKTWWKYVIALNDVAILAIFYHGLRLGSQLHGGWYQLVWDGYGCVLAVDLAYKYYRYFRRRTAVQS